MRRSLFVAGPVVAGLVVAGPLLAPGTASLLGSPAAWAATSAKATTATSAKTTTATTAKTTSTGAVKAATSASTKAPAATVAGSATLPAVDTVLKVVVSNPGTGERRKLRFSFDVGETQTYRVDRRTTQEGSIDGKPSPRTDTDVRIVYTYKITKNTGGKATATFEVIGAGSASNFSQSTTTNPLQSLAGIKGMVTIDAMGTVISGDLDKPPSTDPKEAARQNAVRPVLGPADVTLPETPVGEGADWVVSAVAEPIPGTRTKLVGKFHLAKLEPTRATITYTSTTSYLGGVPAFPGVSPDADVKILEFGTIARGTVIIEQGNLLPRVTSRAEQRLKLRLTPPAGRAQEVVQTSTIARAIALAE